MASYQLRLPDTHTLDRWLDEASWAMWDELTHHTELELLPPHAYAGLRAILHAVFEGAVTTYRSCGLWSYCRVGARPSPWMPREAYRPDDGRVQWYLLAAPRGLAGVVDEVADQMGEFIASCFAGSLPRSALAAAVETALRRGLGRYLYENANCGAHPFCAERTALDPWQGVNEATMGGAYA